MGTAVHRALKVGRALSRHQELHDDVDALLHGLDGHIAPIAIRTLRDNGPDGRPRLPKKNGVVGDVRRTEARDTTT